MACFETRIAPKRGRNANAVTLVCLLACVCAQSGIAGELRVSVIDKSGHGVGEAVVTAMPLEQRRPATVEAKAVMDQRNLAFVPRVIVIAAGTIVEFPNNDTVSHQVYSFSPAKKFQLPLYKGELHTPVKFDREGLVVLGCNIHDEMVGYIYVTEAPYFGKTDGSGGLELAGMPAGEYRVTVWSPFIADSAATLVGMAHVGVTDVAYHRVQLVRELRTRPEPRPRRADWEY
ncbi:MAG: methylamine utilization protein [Steroidobacteraceae bacterium]